MQSLVRKEYVPTAEVVAELEAYLGSGGQSDYITFSGSGEPTLHSRLGEMIAAIKRMSDIPVAVFTCGALLTDPQVRRELAQAVVVNCSLDAVTPATFKAIDRPHGRLVLADILTGLRDFRRDYHGELWLQIMLLRGVNDSPEEIAAMREVIAGIAPDKVHLNTAVRPPAEGRAHPLSQTELQAIATALGPPAEVISEYTAPQQQTGATLLDAQIKNLIARHPATAAQIAATLGLSTDEVTATLAELLHAGEIRLRPHANRDFYAPVSEQSA